MRIDVYKDNRRGKQRMLVVINQVVAAIAKGERGE